MSEDRARILNMLAQGKISAEEAERLLDALGAGTAAVATATTPTGGGADDTAAPLGAPKFLYVKIVSTDGDNVDVKVPLQLLRAGLKLTSLIPPQAMDQINDSMSEHGMSMDFQNLKPEDIEDLLLALREMEVNIDSANGDNVRVYCE
jgi:hypothetical protein